jgi:peptide/nickel transport system permease protein
MPSMTRFLLTRLAGLVLILLLVCLFTFTVFFVLSPDPAVQVCGKNCSPELIDQIRANLGLDKPLLVQFFTFLGGLVAGRTYGEGASAVECPAPCLGYSFQYSQSVWDMITDRLPVTVTLAVGAAVLWLLAGVVGGLISALKQGTWWDRGAMVVALAGLSIPNYVFALVLQYVLVVELEWLPFPQAVEFGEDPALWFQSYLMPWIVLAFAYASVYARLTRANVIETLSENYVRTARAAARADADHHDLRNGLRRAAGRGADHRVGLRPQRGGKDDGGRHHQERPAGHHGRHPAGGVLRRGRQRRRGPGVHGA